MQPPSERRGRELLDEAAIAQALTRIADELVQHHAGRELLLVGIRTNGVPLAERLGHLLEARGRLVPVRPALGAMDITLYRDDVFEGLPRPEVGTTELPGHSIVGQTVILVDDVLYTGRTIRAALDALMDFGRPRRVELAVLIDRGRRLRELPIQPDYVGLAVESTASQTVDVTLHELGHPDRAFLYERSVP